MSDAFYVIGGKWKLRIIIALSEGNKRFNQLQRALDISPRVLSNELKELEMNGFVTRIVDADAFPVTVEYQRTNYADSLSEVLQALTTWGTQHKAKLRRQAKRMQEMES
ncbi:MAG: helix-turn-helix domain-containing protein [Bacteroidota bacterium]